MDYVSGPDMGYVSGPDMGYVSINCQNMFLVGASIWFKSHLQTFLLTYPEADLIL